MIVSYREAPSAFAVGVFSLYNQSMSFVLEALRNKPLALYLMDDTSPFQDYSGYNRTASAAGGTPPKHISLCKGAAFATVLGNSITATFASPVFNQGFEHQSFSLEAWVRVISPNATPVEQQVLGNSGRMDGLTIKGTVVSFVTKYTTAPEARASYDLQQEQSVNLIGVHTKDKNSLFVNGELVSEVSLTEEQQADQFAPTSASLSSGSASSTQLIAVNGIGIYGSALDQVAAARHNLVGRNLPDGEEVVGSNEGDRIPLSLANANLFLDQWWSTEEDWKLADLSGVAVRDDRLVPQFDGDVSIHGEWLDTFALSTANTTSVYGVAFNWDGIGANIEVSLDGTTWEAVQRGVKVETIPAGFDPTNKVLLVRVTFPGGITNDESFLDNLNAVGLLTSTAPSVAGRVVSYVGATQEREYAPLTLHENWGVEIDAGGTVTISADTSDEASPARTLELWIKATGATNPTVSMTGTTYINGVAGSTTLPVDQWVLMHIVAAANVTGSITINGPAQVGQVGIYETALSASDVAGLYAQYVGTNTLRVGDNSLVQVAESANPVKIYAHDWSIQSSG